DHFVARINNAHHGGHHGLGRAATNRDFALRIDGDALRARKLLDNRITQGLRSPGDGVLIDVGGDGGTGGFLDFSWRVEIGKALCEIDRVVFHREPRHFANYGFGEALGFGGKQGTRGLANGLTRWFRLHGTAYVSWLSGSHSVAVIAKWFRASPCDEVQRPQS